MKKIVIAMPQMGNDLFRRYMKGKYVKSLNRSGASVLWIEPKLANVSDLPEHSAQVTVAGQTDAVPSYVAQALECDGLLLPGGADLDPALYHQERSEKTGKPNTLRDTAEPELLSAFLSSGKPILGICRGIQMLNTYFGGTLFQDIKDVQNCQHMDFLSRARFTHPVSIEEGTHLFEIFRQSSVPVNSMHHQAIDKVGDGLIVSAKSADGFVEGIELKDYGFCVGVQWHPEHMSAKSPAQQALFDAFVAACKKRTAASH